jgi:hypothetical protein
MVIVSHRCWAFYESQHAPSVDDVVEVIIACMACAAESVMVECIVSHLASRALQDAPLHQSRAHLIVLSVAGQYAKMARIASCKLDWCYLLAF